MIMSMGIYITLSFSPLGPAFIFSYIIFVFPAGNIYEAHVNLFGSWSFQIPFSFCLSGSLDLCRFLKLLENVQMDLSSIWSLVVKW